MSQFSLDDVARPQLDLSSLKAPTSYLRMSLLPKLKMTEEPYGQAKSVGDENRLVEEAKLVEKVVDEEAPVNQP